MRRAGWDGLLMALALVHGGLLAVWPSIWFIALGMWWNANTISHNFIHSPFFRSRTCNAVFSAYLSMLLGVPQTLWRIRHLAHHAEISSDRSPPGRCLKPVAADVRRRIILGEKAELSASSRWRLRILKRGLNIQLANELTLLLSLWGALAGWAPDFLLKTYLPGLALGLCLCQLQGHYEHVRGTVSHYGWLYNFLFFNDGYHVEHHLRPSEHWRQLPKRKQCGSRSSRWPAVLRFVEVLGLDSRRVQQ